MRRIDLVAATMQGWSRLDPAQRDQFFEAFVSAALRLDRVAMRLLMWINVGALGTGCIGGSFPAARETANGLRQAEGRPRNVPSCLYNGFQHHAGRRDLGRAPAEQPACQRGPGPNSS